MKRFKVGDVLVNPNNASSREWFVVAVLHDKYVLREGTRSFSFTAHRIEVHKHTVVKNTNLITTSSLDYMDSDKLTKEDKKIIKEALKDYD